MQFHLMKPNATWRLAALQAFRRDLLIYGFVAAFIIGTGAVAASLGMAAQFKPYLYPLPFLFVMVLGGGYLAALSTIRAPSPLAEFRRLVAQIDASKVATLAAIGLFFGAFTSAKNLLPLLFPFKHDRYLADIDAMIHGGDAWRLLTWLPYSLTERVYHQAWFAILLGLTGYAVLFSRHRERYIWTFLISWVVLGVFGAAIFMSGGPVFYERLTGSPRFHELFQLLKGSRAVAYADILWEHHAGASTEAGSGISAFPSMHLSMATLFFLFAWRTSKLFGFGMLAFGLIILAGSVRLGWHYAIDGYFSILVTTGIWTAAGWLLERDQTRLVSRAGRRARGLVAPASARSAFRSGFAHRGE